MHQFIGFGFKHGFGTHLNLAESNEKKFLPNQALQRTRAASALHRGLLQVPPFCPRPLRASVGPARYAGGEEAGCAYVAGYILRQL